jgi:hypothetical protein
MLCCTLYPPRLCLSVCSSHLQMMRHTTPLPSSIAAPSHSNYGELGSICMHVQITCFVLHATPLADDIAVVNPSLVEELLSSTEEKERRNVTHASIVKLAALRQPGDVAVPTLLNVLKQFKALLDEAGAMRPPRSSASAIATGETDQVSSASFSWSTAWRISAFLTHNLACLPHT